ncbi:hypothetical protein OSB04_022458 [Centaurea solstitialis]|uniref:Late embryogenesis abundant protein LEA-2 subgroup domain-containing protein n=1 Tax=Centaurea solstitialis TaxID=347529 RepID=A0AA38SW85_9ASTR|nr:hypothetical protein OSB04_022458 [Centaurea solstitialis]
MPVLLVLFASPSGPSFSINLFHDQTLNITKADDSPSNMSIHFDLKLKNQNEAIGLHYPDQINITFSYFPNVSMMVHLAEYKLDSFYQGNGKTRHVRDVVETNGFPRVLEGTDLIAFRVDLVGSYRFKKVGTKRHKVDVGCLVGVNAIDSTKMQSGFIRLVKPVMLNLYSSPSGPTFSINLFHDQAFNITTSPTNLTSIHFDLKLKNKNKAIGLHYPDQLNITFSYFPNVSMIVALADYKLDAFYQGNGKARRVRDVVETSSVPRVLSGTDFIAFRVDLVASYKYKLSGSKKKKVVLGCVVGVNVIDNVKMQTGFVRLVEPGLDSILTDVEKDTIAFKFDSVVCFPLDQMADDSISVDSGNSWCNLILVIIIFFIFFSIYKTRELPSIHVEEFYVPTFNSTTNFTGTTNNTIYINLRLKNRNPVTGLYYDDPLYINISFVPKDQTKSISLAEFGLHGFYQGNGKAKHVKGLLMTRGLESLGSNGTNNGVFRVDFFGKVRYKLIGYHQRHPMLLAANVEVDDKTGVKVGNKAIRLVKSGARDLRGAMLLPGSFIGQTTSFFLFVWMAQTDDIGNACCEVVFDECCPKLPPKLQLFLTCMVTPLLILLVVMLVLYVNPKNPEFSVEKFYVSAFNKTSSNATTNTISFDIKLRNQNKAIGLYYDDPVNLTFSFTPRETNAQIIWKYSVPKFYQGNAQSRRLRDVIQPLGAHEISVFNRTAVAEHASVLPTGAITTGLEPLLYFKVDFVTKVRFKLIGKHHAKEVVVSADVPIGVNTGEKFAKRGIQASEGSRIIGGQVAVMVVLAAINFIVM